MRPVRARPTRKRPSVRRRRALPRELNVGEAKAVFSQLVDEAARGAHFVIAKAGTPVARIVPLEAEPRKIVFGTMKGMLGPEDEKALLDAIEAPLPDDVLESFYSGRLQGPE